MEYKTLRRLVGELFDAPIRNAPRKDKQRGIQELLHFARTQTLDGFKSAASR